MESIHPDTRIGHIHLKVANLDKSLNFYTEVIGMELIQRIGNHAAFVAAGGYHHHIGLNTWESQGGQPPAQGTTGLYHFALLYPSRRELARALQRLIDHHYPIQGAADHGVSQAIYLSDPDQNGIELYWDRPKHLWPMQNGEIVMTTEPLDLDNLLEEIRK